MKKFTAPVFEDGAEFVRSDLGVWSGSGWVTDWNLAKPFRPCTGEADAKVEQLHSELGIDCFVMYVAETQV